MRVGRTTRFAKRVSAAGWPARLGERAGSAGTRGHAVRVLAGAGVKAGLVGAAPSLVDLEGGDLKMSIDFRRVYAAVLEQWLGIPSIDVLGGRFEPLAAFRT